MKKTSFLLPTAAVKVIVIVIVIVVEVVVEVVHSRLSIGLVVIAFLW